jgi:hypothetical protein
VSNFNAALAAIGTYLPLVRGNAAAGEVELALQASIFVHLDSSSFDFLINTDFIVDFPVSYRLGSFSACAQIYHQNSHLSDEFLIGHPGLIIST